MKKSKKGNIIITMGLLLIAAALCLTVYNIFDNIRAKKAAAAALADLEKQMGFEIGNVPADRPSTPDYVLNPDMEMPVREVNGWDYIGVISISREGLQLPVISEWNYPALDIAACRYDGSVYKDNMLICAHNYESYFGVLKRLEYGDIVTFVDMDGNTFNYEVIEIEVMPPTFVEQMKAGDWDLTLFTCTVGAANRVAVRCERIELI